MPEVFFFGCAKGIGRHTSGHYWFGPNLSSVKDEHYLKYLPSQIDGMFAHRVHERGAYRKVEVPQGEALLVHTASHTIVSFWDRSGDERGNSNSSFVAFGHYTWEEMLASAKENFPRLFERFDFELKLFEASKFVRTLDKESL